MRTLGDRPLDQARAALGTQLLALEHYYGITTPELIARRSSDTLPACITRGEAARWAELVATLERLERSERAA